jgi:hypothetical protein
MINKTSQTQPETWYHQSIANVNHQTTRFAKPSSTSKNTMFRFYSPPSALTPYSATIEAGIQCHITHIPHQQRCYDCGVAIQWEIVADAHTNNEFYIVRPNEASINVPDRIQWLPHSLESTFHCRTTSNNHNTDTTGSSGQAVWQPWWGHLKLNK